MLILKQIQVQCENTLNSGLLSFVGKTLKHQFLWHCSWYISCNYHSQLAETQHQTGLCTHLQLDYFDQDQGWLQFAVPVLSVEPRWSTFVCQNFASEMQV